jgi:hypothetical protein
MELSSKAIADLKLALNESFGAEFVNHFSEVELQDVGTTILTLLSEAVKHKSNIAHSALSTVAVGSAESAMTQISRDVGGAYPTSHSLVAS